MVERLKGKVGYGRTANMGQGNKMELYWEEEFYLDEMTVEQAMTKLVDRIDKWRSVNHL